MKIEQFENNLCVHLQAQASEEMRDIDVMQQEEVEYFESRDLASRNSSLTEPRGESVVAAMYDSKITEKPNLSTFSKSLAVKKVRSSPIASQIAALVIPSSPLLQELPIDKARFLQSYYSVLTGYERTELEGLPVSTMIYYAGDVF